MTAIVMSCRMIGKQYLPVHQYVTNTGFVCGTPNWVAEGPEASPMRRRAAFLALISRQP